MEIFDMYMKKVDFEANNLKSQISQIQKEIQNLEQTKERILSEYKSLEQKNMSNPQEIYMQRMYLLELKEKLAHIELEKKKRENDLIPLKETLAGKNAEKKAVKKYSYRKKQEILKKEIKTEMEFVSQLYNRNNF